MMIFKKRLVFIVIMFMVLGGLFYWLNGQQNAKGVDASQQNKSTEQTNLVVAKPAGEAVINNRLSAIGTGRANATVSVTPWTSGNMDRLYVHAGDFVKEHDIIATLDADNESIAVEKAKVELHDAELALERTSELRKTNTATEVQAITARLTLDKAKLALQNAELALERRTIRAPISGYVGILPVDAGNYVKTDTVIARIDDRSSLLVDIWVPERFAPLVKVGDQISATSIARPGETYHGEIGAIDNMLDEESRTLRVRARLDNQADTLRAGMSFQVMLKFPGDPYPQVDPLAIQWSGKGPYVWRVQNGKAEMVSVAIVQRNPQSILLSGAIKKGDIVIIQGLQSLREGSPVTLQDVTAKSTADAAETTP